MIDYQLPFLYKKEKKKRKKPLNWNIRNGLKSNSNKKPLQNIVIAQIKFHWSVIGCCIIVDEYMVVPPRPASQPAQAGQPGAAQLEPSVFCRTSPSQVVRQSALLKRFVSTWNIFSLEYICPMFGT